MAAVQFTCAGAGLGAIAAAIKLLLLLPIPIVVLIVPIAVSIVAALFARPDPGEVLRGILVPTLSLDKTFLSTMVAILGTTISPYLFFWQSDQEVEE